MGFERDGGCCIFVETGIGAKVECRLADKELSGDLTSSFDDIHSKLQFGRGLCLLGPSLEIKMGKFALIKNLDETINILTQLYRISLLPSHEFDSIGRVPRLGLHAKVQALLLGV